MNYSKKFKKKIQHQTPNNEFKNLFKDTHDPNCSYTLRFDPYGRGCYFNCKYCYSRAMQINREGWYAHQPGCADWDKIVEIVKNKVHKGQVIRLGGMTDCFQPIELNKRLSYKLIHLLNRKQAHYLIVTKSPLVIREEYLKLFDKDLAHFQFSIPTTDDEFTKKVSNAPLFEESKNIIETLYSKDFDTCLRCSPFLYHTIDFDKYNNIGVEKCLVEFMRVTNLVNKQFKEYMDLDEYDYNEFKTTFNYRHLPLEKKLEAIKNLDFPKLNICEEVPSHELYFRRHINKNPKSCCNLDLPKEVIEKYEVNLVERKDREERESE